MDKLKSEEMSKEQSQSDMLIVVMKQGNACGAKGHALLRRGLRKHLPVSELDRNGDIIKPPIKECGRVLLVSSSGEPDEGNPHVLVLRGGGKQQ